MKTVVNKDKKFKKGTYYVGDLCYVFTDKQWDEVCDITIDNGDCLSGTFKLNEGCEFALYGTAYGDGEYPDGKGRTYPVDSGSIGCVEKNAKFIHSGKLEEAIRKGLGHLIEMDSEFTTGYNDEEQTEIYFGDVVIMTGYDEDEDEDEDYEDEDEDDEDEYEKGGGIDKNSFIDFKYKDGTVVKKGDLIQLPYSKYGFHPTQPPIVEKYEVIEVDNSYRTPRLILTANGDMKDLTPELVSNLMPYKLEKGGKLEDIVFVREKVYSFLNPMGYSAKVEDWGNGEIHIEPSTTKVGKNRKDFFDGMQIHRFDNGIYEVSEYQAGPDENEMYVYKETKSLIVALKDLIKGNKRKPIKKYAKGGSVEKLPKKRFILYTNPNNTTNRGYVAVGDDVKEVLISSKEYPGSYRVLYQGRGTDEDLQKAKSMFSDYSFGNDVSIMAKGGYVEGREEHRGWQYIIWYNPNKGAYSVSDSNGVFDGDNNYFKTYDKAKEHAEISISSMIDSDEMGKGGTIKWKPSQNTFVEGYTLKSFPHAKKGDYLLSRDEFSKKWSERIESWIGVKPDLDSVKEFWDSNNSLDFKFKANDDNTYRIYSTGESSKAKQYLIQKYKKSTNQYANGGGINHSNEQNDEIPGLNVENQLSNKQVDALYKMKPKLEDPYYPKELIREVGDIAYYKVMINDNEYLLAVDTTGNWDDKWYIVKQNVTPAIASKSNIKEEGAAGVRIELENGNVTVYHSDSNEILLTLNDVPQGTWKKLWNFLRNDLV
jgi:hypothetical protein